MKRLAALVFLLSLCAAPAYPFGQNKIVYDNFKWNIYRSTHFDVYFYDEEKESLQKVVDMAESAYDDLSRKFNYQISKKIPLIFYATHSAFEQTNVMLNFIPEGVGAFAEPAKNRMVLPIDMTDEKLLQLIKHELTHIFEYEIFFQGKLGKTLAASPPTWLMEGLASFMAQDEDSKDRMVLRDAVVTDQIPAITRNPEGYFAYRFGHAVFKFIQERYGWDGLRDFIYEYRNTLGNSVDRALKRAFDLTPDEFDTRFRTWLRRQYLPTLIAKGEPIEYGEPFRISPEIYSNEISPVPSPSGDLLVAFTTYKEDVDIAVFNIPERRLLKNLTPGYTSRFEYPIAQAFTTAAVMGRDIAFAPNGDQIAVFVKKERGRDLLLINPITGNIDRTVQMKIEQQLSPAYSPDGTKIAFAGYEGNRPDIFVHDLGSGETINLTKDAFFDGSPVYSPDGKWLIYSSVVDGWAKLFKLNLANPSERYQLTTGESNDIEAYFSPDGKRIFFASDRQTGRDPEGVALAAEEQEAKEGEEEAKPDRSHHASYNIYSLNLETGELLQYTDVIGGCFTPVVFTGANNKERLVFGSYYKRRWQLYSTTTDKPIGKPVTVELPQTPVQPGERTPFQPPVEVALDPEKIERTGGFKLFVEDVEVNAGVSSDQLIVSRSIIFMSDMLGNRRFVAALDSVSSFSNFDFLYFDLRRRWNWGVRLFDNRSFYTAFDTFSGRSERIRQAYRESGLIGILSYPFDRYHRIDIGAGFEARDLYYPDLVQENGELYYLFSRRRDNFPLVNMSFSGDSTVFKNFGPVSGRRYQISAGYAPDIGSSTTDSPLQSSKDGGTLTADFSLDWREYLQITSRTLLAARVFAAYSDGNAPNFYFFGGLNTLRGYDFRSLIGTRAAFANFEFRFPLIDVIAFPGFVIQGVRGTVFFDIGAATFEGQKFVFSEGRRLVDAKASVGYGVSFELLGLELHWDFAKRYDGRDTEGGFRTSFWIGQTF